MALSPKGSLNRLVIKSLRDEIRLHSLCHVHHKSIVPHIRRPLDHRPACYLFTRTRSITTRRLWSLSPTLASAVGTTCRCEDIAELSSPACWLSREVSAGYPIRGWCGVVWIEHRLVQNFMGDGAVEIGESLMTYEDGKFGARGLLRGVGFFVWFW